MSVHSKIIDACFAAHKEVLATGKYPPKSALGRVTVKGKPSPITLRDCRRHIEGGSDTTFAPILKAYGLLTAANGSVLPDSDAIQSLKNQFKHVRTTKMTKKAVFARAARKSKLYRSAFSELLTLGERDGSDSWYADRMPPKKGQEETPSAERTTMSTAVLGSCFLIEMLVMAGVDIADIKEKMPKLKTQEEYSKFYGAAVKKSGLSTLLFARYTSAGNSNHGTVVTNRSRTGDRSVIVMPEQLVAAHLLGEVMSAYPDSVKEDIEKRLQRLDAENRLAEDFTG